MKVRLGRYRINLVPFMISLVVLLGLLYIPIFLLTRPGPAIDANPPNNSPYFTQFQYPFPTDDSGAQKASFAKNAWYYSSGQQFYNDYPSSLCKYPCGLGRPTHFYVWFPKGSLNADDDYSFAWQGFQFYRGIVVPKDDPRAFDAIRKKFNSAQTGGAGANPYDGLQPIQVGFRNGSAPSPDVEYAEVYGLYYWSTAKLGQKNTLVSLPAIVAGDFTKVGESQIDSSATKIVPSNFTFFRNNLTVTVDRVEFTPINTRVHVTVQNGTDNSIDWDWDTDQTFLVVDNGSQNTETFAQAGTTGGDTAPVDILPTSFQQQATSDGYIFFPRTSFPSNQLRLHLQDPTGTGSEELTLDLKKTETPKAEKEAGSSSTQA